MEGGEFLLGVTRAPSQNNRKRVFDNVTLIFGDPIKDYIAQLSLS